ncbi:MAG: imidazole glycerol phosphate synthase cyclase subunit [Acidimicrobiaceae bacterium]|nr:imidazole glycerol phosphate synthase cyclase subunit [Acidimicrobiaceae bacterium]|tara:strand:- start:590 stop:1378 length:789 start_codon:yes stop_codon:yes gene_type:complete
MLKTRLIPVILLKDGNVVKSKNFKTYQFVGNPFEDVMRFNQWKVDELIYLNITGAFNLNFNYRPDSNINSNYSTANLIKKINKNCFMPLTWGGGIRSLNEIEQVLINGADKVSINTIFYENPKIIYEASKKFGSQAIVLNLDIKLINGKYSLYSNNGKKKQEITLQDALKKIEQINVGEILLHDISKDGAGTGYNLELLEYVKKNTKKKIIILGGIGNYEQFVEGAKLGASGLAAANIWHFKELVDLNAKKKLHSEGISVRI